MAKQKQNIHMLVRRAWRKGPQGIWHIDPVHPLHAPRMLRRAAMLSAPYRAQGANLLYAENPLKRRAHLVDVDRYRAAKTAAQKRAAILYSGRIAPQTLELFGQIGGKRMEMAQAKHHPQGLWVGDSPHDGFGYGGVPGVWDRVTGRKDPAQYGLDPGIGIVARHEGRVYPVSGDNMKSLFGSGWRERFYPVPKLI